MKPAIAYILKFEAFLLFSYLVSHPAKAQMLTNNGTSIFSSAQISVVGDVQINAASTFENDGVLELTGNWINNSGNNCFGTSTGTVVLNGTNQIISGSSVTAFNNLSLAGSGTKTLNTPMIVGGTNISPTGVLTLSSLQLDLNSNELTITNPASGAITRTTGYIESEKGPIPGYGTIHWNIANNTGNYVFPFGNSVTNSYIPVTLEITSPGVGANGYIGIATYPTITTFTPNNRPLPTGLTSLMNTAGGENAPNVIDRFWVFDVNNYTAQPVSNITFSYRDNEWDGSGGSTNTIVESQLKAQRSNGMTWTPVPAGTDNAVLNTVSVPGVNNYSMVWTLVNQNGPLPIELLSFSAKLNSSKTVDLDWITQSEVNNDYFTIERSVDGLNFESLKVIDGAGTTSLTQNYHTIDEHPENGVSYYRLKQTDFNGSVSYSKIESVRINDRNLSSVTIFPNPVANEFFIKLPENSIATEIFITDTHGKLVRNYKTKDLDQMGGSIFKIHKTSLDAGMYFLSTDDGLSGKIVIEN